MNKNIKLSLMIVLILIIVCTVVVIWNPLKDHNDAADSSSGISSQTSTDNIIADFSSSILITDNSSLPDEKDVSENPFVVEDSAIDENSSQLLENTLDNSDLIPEDQPDDPNLNFEASGSSYDDIMVNVLTCLLSKDMSALSQYVGNEGFRFGPAGEFMDSDIVLSANELSNFFSLSAQSYGIYPGSGEIIYLTPSEYYDRYLVPDGFDFSAASVSYNDAADLSAVAGYIEDPKTVSYRFSPDVMRWKRLIIVYGSEENNDVLCGMIYQDVTTN